MILAVAGQSECPGRETAGFRKLVLQNGVPTVLNGMFVSLNLKFNGAMVGSSVERESSFLSDEEFSKAPLASIWQERVATFVKCKTRLVPHQIKLPSNHRSADMKHCGLVKAPKLLATATRSNPWCYP